LDKSSEETDFDSSAAPLVVEPSLVSLESILKSTKSRNAVANCVTFEMVKSFIRYFSSSTITA
jgi:hypothetical protein